MISNKHQTLWPIKQLRKPHKYDTRTVGSSRGKH